MEPILNQRDSGKRLLYIDFLNIAACFGVVAMHCTGKVFVFDASKEWFFSMLLQAVFHFSIPVFFMISGATLMNYREKYSTKEFLKRRFLRAGVPFLIWSGVMLIYKIAIGELPAPIGPRSFLNLFLNNEIQNIYCFFYAIFGIYAAMPLLSLLARNDHRKAVEWYLLLFFLFRAVVPLLRLAGIRITGYFEIPGIAGYFGYVLMGWYLSTVSFKKHVRLLLYACGIFSAGLMFFGTYYLSARAGTTDSLLMDYTSVCTMLLACAVFVFAKHLEFKESWAGILRLFSAASLGIYLLQMIPINEIYRHAPEACSIPFMIGETLCVYGGCFAVVAVIQKIPGIRKIFP